MNTIQKILFAMVFWLPAGLFAQTNIYVSPKGNDANKGTQIKPFKSISKAVAEAQKIKGNIVINLLEGVYYLNTPVVFTSTNSKQKNRSLTLKNYNNKKVTISGSVPLQLHWKKFKEGIWQAQIKQDLDFDALFVNGQLQPMARYPNYNVTAHYYNGTADDVLSKERMAKWKNPAGGYLHALHASLWGDLHYIIKSKNDKGEVELEGGWQNNRRMGMHEKYRFVENIFEELDTVNEWYYDKKAKTLFYYPPEGLDLTSATIETPQLAHLFEFKGSEKDPVTNISVDGLTLTQTLRTFMQNKEPLLRSDWTIYRGGAVLFDGAVDCFLKNCTLTNLGGNAVFFNNFNRDCEVSGCLISNIGASAVCFVGDPNAVRSPSFEYNEFVPLAQIDRTPGPKTNNYPANCLVFGNLIFNSGQIEKQSAGVQLSMCQRITVSHNSIYDVPRAGINVNEGTWGGHVIEFNDVFNTVKESGDHGSFNSWGRDRYWHPDKKVLDSIVENNFDLTMLDVVKPITIRNNRFRCDHGWDIDLDDGSSNYLIYNNLCLNGGIKLREGVNRVVENNIMVNNSFHPHVWFKNSGDVFRHNIVSTGYMPIHIPVWGKETDYNIFPDSASLKAAWANGTDKHSICGQQPFVNPAVGDYRLKAGAAAFAVGFKNFPMDSFGVLSPWLKKLSKKVTLPIPVSDKQQSNEAMLDFMGAQIKNLSTMGEQSATGMSEIKGVLVVNVLAGSAASKFLQTNDVMLSINNKLLNTVNDLRDACKQFGGNKVELTVFRNQKPLKCFVQLEKSSN
ncbi:MAG: PDZ domain-containing protein [Ferruginibacter sp.]